MPKTIQKTSDDIMQKYAKINTALNALKEMKAISEAEIEARLDAEYKRGLEDGKKSLLEEIATKDKYIEKLNLTIQTISESRDKAKARIIQLRSIINNVYINMDYVVKQVLCKDGIEKVYKNYVSSLKTYDDKEDTEEETSEISEKDLTDIYETKEANEKWF